MIKINLIPSWLKSRKILIISISIDFLIYFSLLPYKTIELISQDNILLFIFPIYFIWLISNYIFGTYSEEINKSAFIYRKIILSRIVNILLILFSNLSFILLYFISREIEIKFLIQNILPSILITFLMRDLIIFIVASLILRINSKSICILFISEHNTFQTFKKNLLTSEENYHFINVNLDEISKLENSNINQLIIENKSILNDERFLKNYNLNNNIKKKNIYSIVEWSERYLLRYPSELLDGETIINEFYSLDKKFISMRVKRLGDIILSSILLLFTSPILLVSGIIIYLQDKGPILYSQIRIGRKGKHFRIYKLRSMIINSEVSGAQWSHSNDKRITKFGKLIRTFRVDELPQLVSVLLGDMSLIGPRPERPEIIEFLEKEIPYYNLRHGIRPGISGWAQVNFPYGASIEDTKKKLSFDLYYIHKFNILIDFLILIKTVKIVFKAKGAMPKQ